MITNITKTNAITIRAKGINIDKITKSPNISKVFKEIFFKDSDKFVSTVKISWLNRFKILLLEIDSKNSILECNIDDSIKRCRSEQILIKNLIENSSRNT